MSDPVLTAEFVVTAVAVPVDIALGLRDPAMRAWARVRHCRTRHWVRTLSPAGPVAAPDAGPVLDADPSGDPPARGGRATPSTADAARRASAASAAPDPSTLTERQSA